MTTSKTTSTSEKVKSKIFCTGCGAEFASKNQLFKHLRASEGKCFEPHEYKDFLKHVVNSERNCEKVIILYGYIPGDFYLKKGLAETGTFDDQSSESESESTVTAEESSETKQKHRHGVCDGVHAAQLVLNAIDNVSYGGEIDDDVKAKKLNLRPNRSYGHFGRASRICAQDEYTGAVTEVLSVRMPPLLVEDEGCSAEEKPQKEEEALQKWIKNVNEVLENNISGLSTEARTGTTQHLGKVKLFGRLPAPKRFNAEMDVFHRRIDYLIPADFLFGTDVIDAGLSRYDFFESLQAFQPGRIPFKEDGHNEKKDNPYGLVYVYKLKKLMQRFCTKVIELNANDTNAVLAKEFHRQKRMKHGKGSKNMTLKYQKDKENPKKKRGETDVDIEKITEKKKKNKNKDGVERVLKRKRFHNFTKSVMAHEFLSYRRLDRFFHRATVRFPRDEDIESHSNRPYIVLSVKGDLFLQGQAKSIVGLFIAIVRGYIDEEIIDCVFDEDYTHLVPCPSVPATGLFAGEVNYASWEGKSSN